MCDRTFFLLSANCLNNGDSFLEKYLVSCRVHTAVRKQAKHGLRLTYSVRIKTILNVPFVGTKYNYRSSTSIRVTSILSHTVL